MKDFYYTSSLNVSAWLVANGFKVIKSIKLSSVVIYFDRTKKLEECINKYNNNIELKKFISAFKDVKRIVKETV